MEVDFAASRPLVCCRSSKEPQARHLLRAQHDRQHRRSDRQSRAERVSRSNQECRREFEGTLSDLREGDIAGFVFAMTDYTVHPESRLARPLSGQAAVGILRLRRDRAVKDAQLEFPTPFATGRAQAATFVELQLRLGRQLWANAAGRHLLPSC
jgi:hypothetical protein